MTTDKNRIQAYIDDGLLEKLKAYAASNRLSVSHAVERLLLESDSLSNLPSDEGDSPVTPSASNTQSDSLSNPSSDKGHSRLTLETALAQIREWSLYNVFHQKRHERVTYQEMAKTLRLDGYSTPEGVREWTPEIVSRIIQNRGKL